MTKKAFGRIIAGANQALAIARREAKSNEYKIHVPDIVDIKGLRAHLELSQAAFCARYGFKIDHLRDWEQGRSSPDGAFRAYLMVIEREPDAVDRALAAPARGRGKKSR